MRAAATRLRLAPPVEALRAGGVDAQLVSLLPDQDLEGWLEGGLAQVRIAARSAGRARLLLREASQCDVMLLQRECLPLRSLMVEKRPVTREVPVIWDVDDALWTGASTTSTLIRGGKKKYQWMARHASEVWAGNAHVADWAKQAGARNVLIVPTTVDVPSSAPQRAAEDDLLVWIGTPSTGPFIERLLHEVADGLTGWRVLIVGARIDTPPGVQVEQQPWSPAEEARALELATVGLYPLDPSHPSVLGKSALKCILYMAQGIPFIATATPSNNAVMEHGVEGFSAASHDDWVDYLTVLRDSGVRAAMATAGHARALKDFNGRSWGPELARRIQLYL